MTSAEARQAAVQSIASELVRLEERCQELLDSLPRSENEVEAGDGA